MAKKYLVRFAQIREDFRIEELRSICKVVGVTFPEQDVSTCSLSVIHGLEGLTWW
jgi:hypothetical protein